MLLYAILWGDIKYTEGKRLVKANFENILKLRAEAEHVGKLVCHVGFGFVPI